MFNWFGRKGAPDTVSCAYAPPPWLAGAHEEGFALSFEGQLSEVYRNNPGALCRSRMSSRRRREWPCSTFRTPRSSGRC